MADLEEKVLNTFEEKPMMWSRYILNIFITWEIWKRISGKIYQQIEHFSSDNKVYC